MAAGTLPLVSVVVPVLNGRPSIGRCIEALLRTDYPSERREVIVVDNGSVDGTPEVVGRAPVRLLRERQRGAGPARNRGIRSASGPIVAFTDADCVVTRGWLRQLVAAFEDPSVGGVAGEILPYPPRTPAERYAARIRHLSPQRYLDRPALPFAVTANLSFRREVFDRIGLFDPSLAVGGESTDFCTRFLRETTLSLKYVRKAAVFHQHRATTRELFKQQWGYGRGHASLYIKYGGELPWGRAQTVTAYRDLLGTAISFVRALTRRARRAAEREDLSFAYFELVRKVALRMGFARESLARGYLRV